MLKQLVEDSCVPQTKIADKIGMDRNTFRRILNGKASLKAEHIPELSKILKITPTKLLNEYMEGRQ